MTASAWLLRAGEVLCSLEIAETRGERRRGLLHRDGLTGALLLCPAHAIHTVGMRFDLDVAYCAVDGEELEVVEVCQMRRHRLGRPRLATRAVIEAEAGAFDRWGLQVGDRLEIKR